MAEGAGRRRRVFIPDSRDNGLYLRATWHPDGRQFVVSTWNDDVCTGAVRVPVDQSGELVKLLVDGLTDAAVVSAADPVTARPQRAGWFSRVRSWLARRGHTATADPVVPQPEPIRFRRSA